ncbi:MAG: hypothetical protein LBF85_07500 [Tannerella sp.]|jgi:hypothetical protein|nr:hypothetical protein [Tannerella sp.]
MSKKDYIPSKENVFHPWSKNLVMVCDANGTRWLIPDDDTKELDTAFNSYDAKYQIATNPATRTKAATQAKNDEKKIFIGVVRGYCMGHLLHNKLVTNEDRDLLQLPIYDPKPSPKPIPHTCPVGQVDTSTHQQHTVRVVDSEEINPRGGLPDNVAGFEVWRKMGSNPAESDADFTYVGTSTTPSMKIDYSLTEVGEIVQYRFRWVNARNQPGPWSEVISAPVP